MDVAAGLLAAGLDERRDQGHHREADHLGLRPHLFAIEDPCIGLGGNGLRRLGRNHAEAALRPRQGGFHVEHPLKAGGVAEQVPHLRGSEQVAVDLGIERADCHDFATGENRRMCRARGALAH
jgi:hypothetical protein